MLGRQAVFNGEDLDAVLLDLLAEVPGACPHYPGWCRAAVCVNNCGTGRFCCIEGLLPESVNGNRMPVVGSNIVDFVLDIGKAGELF